MQALGCSQVAAEQEEVVLALGFSWAEEKEEEEVVLALGCSQVEKEKEEEVVLAHGCSQVEQEERCPGECFAELGLHSAQPWQGPIELGYLLIVKSPEQSLAQRGLPADPGR